MNTEQCHKLIIQAYGCNGGLELAKALLQAGTPGEENQNSNSVPWCICGNCRNMDQPIENVCCRKTPYITTHEWFETVVLDSNVLLAAIASRADVFADELSWSVSDYRKAAYRQYIMWEYGYLGRSNHKVP